MRDRTGLNQHRGRGYYVRFGSKGDMCAAKRHVCFAPESGHVRRNWGCLLWARSGHWLSITRSLGRPGGEWTVGQQY